MDRIRLPSGSTVRRMTAILLLAALFTAVSGAVPARAASIPVTTTADE